MTKHISINPGFISFEETCIYSKIMSDFKYVKSSYARKDFRDLKDFTFE